MHRSDDTLSTCLLWLAAENGFTTSHDALVAGLPLVDGRLTPSVFARAADRVNMKSTLVRQPLERLNSLLFPCIVLLENNQACLVQNIDPKTNTVQALFPELDMQPQTLDFASVKIGRASCRERV